MDLDRLVDAVTREIMKRLEAEGGAKIMAADCDARGIVNSDCDVVCARCGDAPGDCSHVLLDAAAYAKLCGCAPPTAAAAAPSACCSGSSVDLSSLRLVSERHMKEANVKGGDEVAVGKNAIVTALAVDYAKGRGAKIVRR